jgi:hypothetical protein
MSKLKINYLINGLAIWIMLSSFLACSAFRRSQGSGYAPGSTDNKASQQGALPGTGFDQLPTTVNFPKSMSVDEKIVELEKRLSSQREKEHYSRLLPWFESKEERLNYLLEPHLQSKEKFAQEFGIWQRAQNPSATVLNLVRNQDIALGMPQVYVRQSWGEPQKIEISGDPYFKNERWKYTRQISTPQGFRQEKRTVFFEGGKVAGWDTE